MTTQVSSGNLPIPNDTGANVLADINENLLALQSNNAGDNAPAVAKKHQTWVDTSGSTDVLKIRGNSDNSNFITLGNIETNLGMMPKTGGAFQGEITTVAGTKTSPAIKLDDANTGLYEPASDTIGLTCGGADVAYVETTGIEIKDGKKLEFRDSGNSNVVSLQAPALTSDVALTLPNSDGDDGDVLKSDGNGVTSWTAIQGVETGTILLWGGSETNIPSGFFECDGSQKSSSTYPDLATVCASLYNYGQTPDSGKFFLPDLRGRFVRGWDHGANRDSNRTLASEQLSRNKRHSHTTSHSISGGNHTHGIKQIRRVGSNPSGLVGGGTNRNITLGSGQTYHVGYQNSSGSTSNVIFNSGSLSLSLSLTVNNDPTSTAENESRPINIALIYIIKN